MWRPFCEHGNETLGFHKTLVISGIMSNCGGFSCVKFKLCALGSTNIIHVVHKVVGWYAELQGISGYDSTQRVNLLAPELFFEF